LTRFGTRRGVKRQIKRQIKGILIHTYTYTYLGCFQKTDPASLLLLFKLPQQLPLSLYALHLRCAAHILDLIEGLWGNWRFILYYQYRE
jgi:hypothetical protein